MRSSTSRAPAMPLPMTTRRLRIRFLDSSCTHLELRHPAHGVERVVGEPVRRTLARPVKWHEHRVGPDVAGDARLEDRRAAARAEHHALAVANPVAARLLWMHLHDRFGRA